MQRPGHTRYTLDELRERGLALLKHGRVSVGLLERGLVDALRQLQVRLRLWR
jgi:hypothetical protein